MNIVKSALKFLLAATLVSGLIGCAASEPTVFGVPQSQWTQLSKQQQDEVIHGYNQRAATREINRPLTDTLGVAKVLLRHPS